MAKRRNRKNANRNVKMETHQQSGSFNKGHLRRGRGHVVLTSPSSDNENDNTGKVRLGMSTKSIKIQKSNGVSNFEKQSLRSQTKTVLAASRRSNSGTLSPKLNINQSLLELPNDEFILAGLASSSASATPGRPSSAYVSVEIERYDPAVGLPNSSRTSNFGRSTSKRVSHREKRKAGDTDSTSDQEDLRIRKKQVIAPADSIQPPTKAPKSQTERLPQDGSVSKIRRHSILNGANKIIIRSYTEGAVSTTATTQIQSQPQTSTSLTSTDGLASSSSVQLSVRFENGMKGNSQSQTQAILMPNVAHTALSASAIMYSRVRSHPLDTNNQWSLRSAGIRQKITESLNKSLQKEVHQKQQYSLGKRQGQVPKHHQIKADVFQNPRIAKSGSIRYTNPFVELTPMVLIGNQNNIFDPVFKAQEASEVEEREESQPQLQGALETASVSEGILISSSHSATLVQTPTLQDRHILLSNIISINSTSNSKKTVSRNDHWINQAPLTRRRASEAAVLTATAETDMDVDTSVALSSAVSIIPPRTKSLAHTEYPQMPVFVCDFCLAHNKLKWRHDKHLLECQFRGNQPPGRVVYEKGTTRIYEVDGNVNEEYCFNLSKLSKRYVNSVSNRSLTKEFMYYVLYVSSRFAGYFSKEKALTDVLNLGVLLVLPSHQKQGFGKLLVSFSYEISKLEKQIGTPERPFSKSGLKCYLSYWMEKIVEYVTTRNLEQLTLDELSNETYIHVNDILEAIQTFCKVYKVRDFGLVKFPKSVCNRFFKTAAMRAGNEVEVTGNGPSSSTSTGTALALSTISLKNNILDVKCIRWSK